MSASLLIAMPEGSARDELAAAVSSRGPAVETCDPGDLERLTSLSRGRDAVVHVAGEDAFEAAAGLGPGAAAAVAEVAAEAGARLVFCSSVLIYADGGSDELMANDPELDPVEALRPLADAELEVFGSRAEVLVLRLGILLARGSVAAESLRAEVEAGRGVEGTAFVPILDRGTLASAIASTAASSLHGGWDVVSSCAVGEELFHLAAGAVGAREPGVRPDGEMGPEAVCRWRVSRLVTGAALREAGAVDAMDWRVTTREALG